MDLKEFLKEAAPTNSSGSDPAGFSSDATATGPVAGFDKRLFPIAADDLLSQDYQTPGQPGLAKWRFSNIWPVEKLTMAGIDAQVAASKEYTDIMDEQTQLRVRKNLSQFMMEAKESKKCPDGQ